MKRFFCVLGMLMCLTGCSSETQEIREAMQLRDRILSSQECSFQAEIIADYGENLHAFSMSCKFDAGGNLEFEITEPETISGIRGIISDDGGNIIFEEHALYFPLLTDDLLIPASAPWIFMKTLRGGYITASCKEENLLHLTIHDGYAEDPLVLDIWLNDEHDPVRGDILHDGKRILSLNVENFVIS